MGISPEQDIIIIRKNKHKIFMYAITWLLIGIYSTSTVVGEIARLPFVIMPLNCIFSFHGYIFYTNAVTVIGATRTILIFQNR